jgi:hypothetical protein
MLRGLCVYQVVYPAVRSHVPLVMKDVKCPETSGRCPETVHEQHGDALWIVERTPNGLCMDSGEVLAKV